MKNPHPTNILLPFSFDNLPVRGKVLRLANLSGRIPSFTNKPASLINQPLAELVLASALLVDDFKAGCDVSLQVQHAPSGSLLVAQCNAQGHVRAYANEAAHTTPFSSYTDGQGVFTATVHRQGADQPYQSIVPMQGDSVAEVLEKYFTQSVQARTLFRVWIDTYEGQLSCGGLFLQSLPEEEPGQDDWHRLNLLLDTLRTPEAAPGLITPNELLRRLFHEDQVRLYPKKTLSFQDDNPRERMRTALAGLGEETCQEMLSDGPIKMEDAYTGQAEEFTAEDIAAIFTKQ